MSNISFYYINLSNRKDRNNRMVNQFNDLKITNYQRIQACSPSDYNFNNYIKNLSDTHFAILGSHIKAISHFYHNSKNEYAIIFEDDVDLSSFKKIGFNLTELFHVFSNTKCFQLAVSNRVEHVPNFSPHERSFWDFSCLAYMISKSYAKDFLDRYCIDNKINLDSLNLKMVYDSRIKKYFTPPPWTENVIYSIGNVVTWPIFSFYFSPSSRDVLDSEADIQIKKSIKLFKKHWSSSEIIKPSSMLK